MLQSWHAARLHSDSLDNGCGLCVSTEVTQTVRWAGAAYSHSVQPQRLVPLIWWSSSVRPRILPTEWTDHICFRFFIAAAWMHCNSSPKSPPDCNLAECISNLIQALKETIANWGPHWVRDFTSGNGMGHWVCPKGELLPLHHVTLRSHKV